MFGRLKNLFQRKSLFDEGNWSALIDDGRRRPPASWYRPTTRSKCVAVLSGVQVRCETLGSLPCMLYERREDGGKERATDHPLYRLIHGRPNAWTSASEFVMQLEKDTITHAGGYAFANRSGEKIVKCARHMGNHASGRRPQ